MPATWSWSTDKISCKTEAKSALARRLRLRQHPKTQTQRYNPRHRNRAIRNKAPRVAARKLRNKATLRESRNEHIQAVYFTAGRHHIDDGGDLAGGLRGLSAVAGLGAATSRLPDHSGADLLSRCQPGRNGIVRDGTAGAAVWPGSGPESDDVDELVRQFDHHAAIRSRSEYRRGRAGSASVHQWCFQ